MQRQLTRLGLIWLGLLIVAGQCPESLAQERRRVPRVRITDLEINNRPSPKYQDTTSSKAKREGRWLQLLLEYESDARDGWIDTLALDWCVLLRRGSSRPLLLKSSVSYADVDNGQHHAAVYLRPAILKRYLNDQRLGRDDIRVYIEVRAEGTRIERYHYPEREPETRWWELQEPRVRVRNGELLARDKTPFGPMDYDFYEHIQSSN